MKFRAAALLCVVLLSACRGLGQTPPPAAFDPDSLATAIALTESAPLPGFETADFSPVDARLSDLPGFRYTVEMRFDGVFGQTTRPTSGFVRAEVWWDDVAQARRVVMSAEGDAFVAEPRQLEGVRLGEDYYLVDAGGRCLANVEDMARAVAALDAGSLIGGVEESPYEGVQAILNGTQAYRYAVPTQAATLPAIHLGEGSTLSLESGELWVSPEYRAVVRYYANVDVENVRLFEGQLPVSGQVFVRYDVYELGTPQNISIPFGC